MSGHRDRVGCTGSPGGAEECEERPAVVDPRKKKRLRSVRVAAGSR